MCADLYVIVVGKAAAHVLGGLKSIHQSGQPAARLHKVTISMIGPVHTVATPEEPPHCRKLQPHEAEDPKRCHGCKQEYV